jgi:hypothetical protein
MNAEGRGVGPIANKGVSRVGTEHGLKITVAALCVLLLVFAAIEYFT